MNVRAPCRWLAVVAFAAGCHRARPELPAPRAAWAAAEAPSGETGASTDVRIAGPNVWRGDDLEVLVPGGWMATPFRGGLMMEGPRGVVVTAREGNPLGSSGCDGPPPDDVARRSDVPWVGAGVFRVCWPEIPSGGTRFRWTALGGTREVEVTAPAGESTAAWDAAMLALQGLRRLKTDGDGTGLPPTGR